MRDTRGRFVRGDSATARSGGLALQERHAAAARLAKRAADLEAALRAVYVMTTTATNDPGAMLGRIGAFVGTVLDAGERDT